MAPFLATSSTPSGNGKKASEGTYKDGREDGLSTGWHENGQKLRERTFRDGKKISEKFWDRDGNRTK